MTVEVAMVISILSCVFSIFFGIKNSKRADDTDTASRVAEITRLEVKLDSILTAMNEFKSELKSQQDIINGMSMRLVQVEESAKQAHKRIDEIKRS